MLFNCFIIDRIKYPNSKKQEAIKNNSHKIIINHLLRTRETGKRLRI